MNALEVVYKKLKSSNNDDLIDKIRMSPDGNRIVIDVNFNRAVTVKQVGNVLVVDGDKLYADKIKSLIEEVVK